MKKLNNNQVITILGSTGELGSQLANYLIKKQKHVLLVFRRGHLDKLKRVVKLNNDVQILEVSSLFDKNLLHRIRNSSKIIFNLAGLVSLSFAEKVYSHVLLINGLFPGLLVQSEKKIRTPIVYASTQRMKILTQRDDVKRWVSTAIREFDRFVKKTNMESNFEEDILNFTKKLLVNYPIPSNVNIYELSKALGETMLQRSNNSIILRISSCYGPGCSTRRTVGRLIFSRLFGQEAIEKEEVRDFLYTEDLNEVFKKLVNFSTSKPYLRYCCSGTNTSKSYIITKITEKTPNDNGVLKILETENVEVFRPSGKWLKNILQRNPTKLDDGLIKTIKSFKKLYFPKNPMAIIKRLTALYDQIKQKVDEQGISLQEVEKIRSRFFTNRDGRWEAHEAFWKPTGLVFGYPFPEALGGKFVSLREEILAKLGLEFGQYWLPDEDVLHLTIVSYSHYSESGMDVIPLPVDEVPKTRQIIESYKPIKISFRGVLVTNYGSLLVKGFVDNEDLFLLRGELMSKIRGITQQPQNLVHVKLVQILNDVPYELTERVNRIYSSTDLGSHVFSEAKTPRRELIRFKIS